MPHIDVRFFAGAAHAFGTEQAQIQLGEGATLGALIDALNGGAIPTAGPDSKTVLSRCSFLVNRVSSNDHETVLQPDNSGEIRVDVLPPFAGG